MRPQFAADNSQPMAEDSADVDLDALIDSLPACKRCRDCRRGCDTLLPSCRQCTKAGAECLFLDHALDQYVPRSYISTLVNQVRSLTTNGASKLVADGASSSATPFGPNMDAPSEESDCTHFYGYAAGAYRYVGGASCLSTLSRIPTLPSSRIERQQGPKLDILPYVAEIKVDLQVHKYLIDTFFTMVYPIFQVVDPGLKIFANTLPTDISPSDSFVLNIVYAIACLLVADDGYQWLALGESRRHKAMEFLDSCTARPTMTALNALVLSAIHSLFDSTHGNLGQLLALASRLVLDLEVQDHLPAEEEAQLRQMHMTIFCIENAVAGTLGRPSMTPEPACSLNFDVNSPSEYLCSIYRVQHRFRKGDKTAGNLLPTETVRTFTRIHPTLKMALYRAHLVTNPSHTHAVNLLSSLANNDVLLTFVMPYWAYEAAVYLFSADSAFDRFEQPKIVLEAYGNAIAILARATRKWPHLSALERSLMDRFQHI